MPPASVGCGFKAAVRLVSSVGISGDAFVFDVLSGDMTVSSVSFWGGSPEVIPHPIVIIAT